MHSSGQKLFPRLHWRGCCWSFKVPGKGCSGVKRLRSQLRKRFYLERLTRGREGKGRKGKERKANLLDLMETIKQTSMTPTKSRLARTFAKIFRLRVSTVIAPVDGVHKSKPQLKLLDNQNKDNTEKPLVPDDRSDKGHDRAVLEAHLAKIFACISSIKAAYAQLQFAQSPYDADGIKVADEMIVSGLKDLSELKQCYVKKQFDISPGSVFLTAEIQEQKSLLRTYDVMHKKLEYQQMMKDSEVILLKQKLGELNKQNRSMEKRMNQSGPLSVLDNLHLSAVSPRHFATVLRHAVKSIRSFVRLMIDEMKSADWDLDAAASSIVPGIVYLRSDHKCYAYESFICREVFDAFQHPNFSVPDESLPEKRKWPQFFFNRFIELKSIKPKDYLTQKPKSAFAKFCQTKYLQLVHPRMESAFFGNLSQRNQVISGNFPETMFFALFAEMAKRVWLLHCLSFSFQPEGTIFQVSKGCRFSEVYMETIAEEALPLDNVDSGYDPRVAFTVVPGFKIGKAIVQCQVYLLKSMQG
ncbi:hypothetical protein MLD38_002286 [Melastoma candidum]|uniref:Uncharacterized protein n=1 Tax=Melastoma candidum TaxID=119954 RepID=A0ACB9SGD2_9MYRT|nr:hypothetical protein MLD38_002286 [Melastoma candidum]